MADTSHYTEEPRKDQPEPSDNWRSVGEIAAHLARKAGGAK